jgi:glycosyltransferase involved in cell wall biosynthesis
MSQFLKTIAIDLTPVIPGGENGGNKVFILELLKLLSKQHKNTWFILLTRENSHQELISLESFNMRRLLVLQDDGPLNLGDIHNAYEKNIRNLRPFLIKVIEIVKEIFIKKEKIDKPSLMKILNADLLFCPFTAMTYSDPAVPTVCTIYDWQHRVYPQFFESVEVQHRDQMLSQVCKYSSAIATISDFSKMDTISLGGAPHSRVKTIYLKMSGRAKKANNGDISILNNLGLTPKEYFIYPANFWKHKNHEMLLTAFGLARDKGMPVNIKLVCTGAPGERRDFLLKAIKKMGFEGQIILPGYVSNQDLATLMFNSSGLIFPSLYEGFGLPPIEAMSLGVPVACSDSGSLPEVVGNAAIIFNPTKPEEIANAMSELILETPKRERFLALGKQRASQFEDTSSMAREYWTLFEQALAHPNKTSSLDGVYPDGWLKKEFKIMAFQSKDIQNIELVVESPQFNPIEIVKLQLNRGDYSNNQENFNIKKGESSHITFLIHRDEIIYFKINNSFSPDKIWKNGDIRDLSLILKSCRINKKDGSYIEIFPGT